MIKTKPCHVLVPFIYLLKSYSPVNHTGSPQGFSQVQIPHKLNTIQNMHIIYTNVKHINIIQNFVPSGIVSIEKWAQTDSPEIPLPDKGETSLIRNPWPPFVGLVPWELKHIQMMHNHNMNE